MVRPNGSTMGRDSAVGALAKSPFIQQALSLGQPTSRYGVMQPQSMHDAVRLQSAVSCASPQRLGEASLPGAGAGSGNGEAIGAATLAFGRFGFFGAGTALPAAFGGGPAG